MLHAEVPDEENAVITAEVIGGDHGPTTLDIDGIIIFRIKNNSQKIKFVAYVDDEVIATRVFTINGLILA